MISFCVEETPGGFTWSYSSLLGHLLLKAEALYGERDKSYTILGVEMRLGRLDVSPRIWYSDNVDTLLFKSQAPVKGILESLYINWRMRSSTVYLHRVGKTPIY